MNWFKVEGKITHQPLNSTLSSRNVLYFGCTFVVAVSCLLLCNGDQTIQHFINPLRRLIKCILKLISKKKCWYNTDCAEHLVSSLLAPEGNSSGVLSAERSLLLWGHVESSGSSCQWYKQSFLVSHAATGCHIQQLLKDPDMAVCVTVHECGFVRVCKKFKKHLE